MILTTANNILLQLKLIYTAVIHFEFNCWNKCKNLTSLQVAILYKVGKEENISHTNLMYDTIHCYITHVKVEAQ